MKKQRNILFIINPNSGLQLFPNLDTRIAKSLDGSEINATIKKTKYAGHAIELCQEAITLDEKPDSIIAVGGDGTVNEVINGIGLSGIPMGIIPIGSGNGLARHLGISLLPMRALRTIVQGFHVPIDMMQIGKTKFAANVAGVGFDALVSWKFKDTKTRGPISYARIILEEFLNHKPANYTIKIDKREFTIKSSMITVANSSQFGNNAVIAPNASLTDGYLDLCILKPFPKALTLDIATKIMTNQIGSSKYYESHLGKKITIKQDKAIYQIDGDSVKEKKKIKIRIKEKALNMIIPKKSKNNI